MSVLHSIVERKKTDVAARMRQAPFEDVRKAASPSCRSFSRALTKSGRSFIFEIKKASPSLGLIRADFDVRAIVNEYEPFADALSVITDAPYFGGSHENLSVARSMTEKPILCKDFVVSPYQVYEARHFGADAVLLMLSVLGDREYAECADAAAGLSMDALTEIHDERELERALNLGAKIIGINNRDLKTLKIDLTTTERLAPLIPKGKIVVCESGITNRGDLLRLDKHADAFLIGSRLMGEKNLGQAVRELLSGRVKVCGLTRSRDAKTAYEKGAIFGGLIFAPESPRCIDETAALEITRAAPLDFVGVFVNSPVCLVAETAKKLSLSAVQLHGDEDADFVGRLRAGLNGGCEIWKAARVENVIPEIAKYGCDRLLLDAFDKQARGGTGKSFNWRLLDNSADKERIILAGGITPDNAHIAAAKGCYAIDVNSGVEDAPGKKNDARMTRLFSSLGARLI